MADSSSIAQRRLGALALIRALRRLDYENGIKHSGIALDVGILLYERAGTALTVKELCALTGYSGPTVRLVMNRLVKAEVVTGALRQRRTVAYALTPKGTAAFDVYVERIWDFGQAVAAGDVGAFIAAAEAAPPPARRSSRRRGTPRGQMESPDREAAD
ncbi:hypothetical protein DFH01_19705 [Falsiroseomonas bella]|uniref:MarR family transcriptional regulator n=1 Tax=Falsiroseomonas bella TaxID=2184016 RepID=A0A317F9R6_9PROT|nr:hypothetical protein [Falsiroseomonas bella]PWS35804.1 hypothetical protein DFH01_19705 [Falsiroseomonas bella]